MKLNFALSIVLSAGIATVLQAQDSLGVYKNPEAQKSYLNGTSKFPAKPRNMWELGVHAGYLQIAGDVNPQPGYAVGLSIRKALGYAVSLRGNLIAGRAFGLNYLPSQRSVGMNPALGATANLPSAAASGITNSSVSDASAGGYGWDEKYPGATGASATRRGSGLPFYYNYRCEYAEVSLQALVSLNNINFHQQRNKWDFYALAGLGMQSYGTRHDALNSDGKLYDQTKFAQILADKGNNKAAYDEIREKIKSQLDGTYETAGDDNASLWDFLSESNKSGTGAGSRSYKVNPLVNIGAGIAYRVSNRVSIALEHQATYSDDDLLDGYRWTEQGDFTQNKDAIHYTNLRLNFNLGSFKKSVEPLWWRNPLDRPYAQIQRSTAHDPESMLKDDDKDGVPNMFDKEPDTVANAPVDTQGRTLDSDGDGVKDHLDKEPFTAPGLPVDADGVGSGMPKWFNCELCGSSGSWFLPSVHFNNDSYCIKSEFYSDLKNVATVMAKNPKVCIEVKGFADDGRGSDAKYNDGISYNRANAVKDYLVSKFGVAANRIAVKTGGTAAIGSGLPSGSSTSYMNRRVEIATTACGAASDSAPAGAASAGTSGNCETPVFAQPPVIIQQPTNNDVITPRVNKGFIKR